MPCSRPTRRPSTACSRPARMRCCTPPARLSACPTGQMGNSEVGHLNIGAGRVVLQDLPRIDQAIAAGEVEKTPAMRNLIARLKETGGSCHLMGLVSPGGVHSHQDQGAALAKILNDAEVPVLVHAFTDGRDTPPRSAGDDLKRLRAALPAKVKIATVCGRYYAMDRDNRWEREEKAYRAVVEAKGPHFPDAQAVIADSYAHDVSDEFVIPAVVGDYRGMQDGDGLLCFNFRADRVREILDRHSRSQVQQVSARASRRSRRRGRHGRILAELNAMMQVIFPAQSLKNVIGEVVANDGRTQLRIAETEKYPHVTYFLQRRPRGALSRRGAHHGAVAQGRDLRFAAGNVGARGDRQGRRRDRVRQIRPDRAQLRQSRHGRPHRQPSRRDQGGGNGRCRARADCRAIRKPAARCWSLPTTAIAN